MDIIYASPFQTDGRSPSAIKSYHCHSTLSFGKEIKYRQEAAKTNRLRSRGGDRKLASAMAIDLGQGEYLPAAKPTGLVEPLKTLVEVLNLINERSHFLINEHHLFSVFRMFLIFSESNGVIFSEMKQIFYTKWGGSIPKITPSNSAAGLLGPYLVLYTCARQTDGHFNAHWTSWLQRIFHQKWKYRALGISWIKSSVCFALVGLLCPEIVPGSRAGHFQNSLI